MKSIRFNNGWVLGPKTDAAVFFLPFVFAMALTVINPALAVTLFTLTAVVFVRNAIDMSHIVSTIYVGLQREQTGILSKGFLYSAPLVVLAFMWSMNHFISMAALVYTMAYWSLWHVYRQQHGWLMISKAKGGGDAVPRWIETAMVFNLVQYPFVFWHSAESHIARSYLNAGDLVLRAGPDLTQWSFNIHWAINIAYVALFAYVSIKNRSVNLGKISILLSTWCMFYGGLVWMNDTIFWTFVGPLTHGVPYILAVYRDSMGAMKKKNTEPKGLLAKAMFCHALAFPFIVYGIVFYWDHGPGFKTWMPENVMAHLPQVFWFPTLLHYYLDTVVWRRSQRAHSLIAPEAVPATAGQTQAA